MMLFDKIGIYLLMKLLEIQAMELLGSKTRGSMYFSHVTRSINWCCRAHKEYRTQRRLNNSHDLDNESRNNFAIRYLLVSTQLSGPLPFTDIRKPSRLLIKHTHTHIYIYRLMFKSARLEIAGSNPGPGSNFSLENLICKF